MGPNTRHPLCAQKVLLRLIDQGRLEPNMKEINQLTAGLVGGKTLILSPFP
jgi:hypothetical protein